MCGPAGFRGQTSGGGRTHRAGRGSRSEARCAVTPHPPAEGEPAGRSAWGNNAILVEGDPVTRFMFYGPAAGAGPIASAEVAEILNIAGIRCVVGPQAWLVPFPSRCHQMETLRTCGWSRHVPLQLSVLLHALRSGCDRQIATIPHRDWNPACAWPLPPSLPSQRRRPSPPACGRFEGWLSGQNTEALVRGVDSIKELLQLRFHYCHIRIALQDAPSPHRPEHLSRCG